jgi:hypothetical protein
MYSIEQQQAGLKLIDQLLGNYKTAGSALAQAGFDETPAGMLFLLRVANGETEPMALATGYTGQSEQAIKTALIVFIEQFSLVAEGDHYRVLSLNPWCSLDEAKEHYRLLIRLFHPDRSVVDRGLAEHYAARINQSYLALKQQFSEIASTAVADLAATNASAPAMSHHAASGPLSRAVPKPVTRKVPRRTADSLAWLPGGLTPVRIWLMILALAAVMLLSVYWVNKRAIESRHGLSAFVWLTDQIDQAATSSKMEIKDYQALIAEHRPADSLLIISPEMSRDAPVALNQSPPYGVAPVPSSDSPHQLPDPLVQTNSQPDLQRSQTVTPMPVVVDQQKQGEISPAAGKVAESGKRYSAINNAQAASVIAAAGALETASGAEASRVPQVTDSQAKPAPDRPTGKPGSTPVHPGKKTAGSTAALDSQALKPKVTEHASPGLTEEALFNLISKLVLTYNQGDIEGFMALLDEDVHTEQGVGKGLLRQSYLDVFSNSQSREIMLKNLQWQKSDQGAVGMSSYQVKLVKKGESGQKQYAGTLRLEVSKTQDQLKISGFYNLPDMK